MRKQKQGRGKRAPVDEDGYEDEVEEKAPKLNRRQQALAAAEADDRRNVITQFVSSEGVKTGAALDLPVTFTENELQVGAWLIKVDVSSLADAQEVLNELLSNDEPLPYSFFVRDEELVRDLGTFLDSRSISTETVLEIVYQPQAVFRVRPLTRCTSTLPGHTDSVLVVSFSPDGSVLASGQ